MKTISEISLERSIDRSTLLKAAQRGVFGGAARKSGDTWLIDDESLSFEAWHIKHQMRGETTIKVETPSPPEWVTTSTGKRAWKNSLEWRCAAADATEEQYRTHLLREAEQMYGDR